MICLEDRAGMTRTLPSMQSRLRPLVERVVTSLATPYSDFALFTRILILEPGDTLADVIAEIGLLPLVDAMLGVPPPPPGPLSEQP